MAATRTQIYLTEGQRRQIDQLAASQGLTLAEVVRRALDRYLADERPDPGPALSSTFGADPTAGAPDRDEWNHG